eukprot:Amastigsp_a841279_504.p4 type:complete len:177 gc:universal Amastigsp_a841279_504:955-425(-)
MGPSSTQRSVLGRSRRVLRARLGAGVPELHLGLEHRCAGPRDPGNDGLGHTPRPEHLGHLVLGRAAELAQKNNELDLRDALVPRDVVRKRRACVRVAADGDALKEPVGHARENRVALVREPARFRDKPHRARAVKLARHNVLRGPGSVANLERPGLDAAHCGGPDDRLANARCFGN